MLSVSLCQALAQIILCTGLSTVSVDKKKLCLARFFLLLYSEDIIENGDFKMEVKDYSEEHENNHYNGVPSMYGKRVNAQRKEQPKYCMPGEPGDDMKGEKRNEQAGA